MLNKGDKSWSVMLFKVNGVFYTASALFLVSIFLFRAGLARAVSPRRQRQ